MQTIIFCILLVLDLVFYTMRLDYFHKKTWRGGFHGGLMVKNPPVNAWDMRSSPDSGRSHAPQSN